MSWNLLSSARGNVLRRSLQAVVQHVDIQKDIHCIIHIVNPDIAGDITAVLTTLSNGGGHAPWLVVISGVGDELSLYKELCGLPQQDHHSEVEKSKQREC